MGDVLMGFWILYIYIYIFNYLDNGYKNIKITNLTSNRALCDKIILFKSELKII